MKIYCRPRRAGKTYFLVENELLGKNAILLVMNEREKVRIIKNHGLSIKAAKKILTWDNIHEKLAGMDPNKKIIIDNLDAFLRYYLYRDVDSASVNGTAL